MKRIIIVLIGVIISLSGKTQEIAFHGKISGIDSAQISVVVLPLKFGEMPISDITHCVRGKFDFRVKPNLNMWHLVRLNCEEFNSVFGSEKSGSQELKNREILFFVQPNDHVSILANVGAYGLDYQITGNEISGQSSEVNKSVFWGTWCGYCLKGIPKMKEYYSRYNDQIEFLGIACKDNRQVWIKAITKYDLEWVNLFAEDEKITDMYGVEGYPTKMIIDKEGKIVLKTTGESDEFYDKMDELFSN